MKKENASLQESTQRNGSWLFAATGCIVFWVLIGTCSGNGLSLKSLIGNAYTASFLTVAGLAQMLVVTTGYGAIDPSIPGMITLGAYVGMGLCNGQNSMIPPVLLAVVVSSVLVGSLNSMMIIRLKIPAIIATMAMNYLTVTVTMLIGHNFNVFTVPSTLKDTVAFRVVGVPVTISLVALLTPAIHSLLTSTTYGKRLLVTGQNLEAARLAGVDVGKTQILTYMFTVVPAGLCDALISARVTGAYLGVGNSCQMDSIACIVMGGMLMPGGHANVADTLVGSLFLYLVISCIQLMEANADMQSMVKGALIIAVLLVGAAENSGKNLRRKREGGTVCEIKTSQRKELELL